MNHLAALLPRRRGGTLPATVLERRAVEVDRDHLARYDRVCGFRLGDALPATYPHVLAFPLAMRLMTAAGFPFPVIGLVHVANRITVRGPIGADTLLDLSVHSADLRPHRRGRQFDIVATAAVEGVEVWRGVSTYLRKGPSPDAYRYSEQSPPGELPDAYGYSEQRRPAQLPDAYRYSEQRRPAQLPDAYRYSEQRRPAELPDAYRYSEQRRPGEPTDAYEYSEQRAGNRWRIPGDIGRDYASVSGDRNPIHTSRLGARLFGFPRPIAHGMWSKARCLAALEGRLPDEYTVDVAFRRPVPLPGTVSFTATARPDGWEFGLGPHLAGQVGHP